MIPSNDPNQNRRCDCCDEDECLHDCPTVYDFLRLTDEMVKTIIGLDEELVRWRQALIKHLPPEWAEGLLDDILDNTSRDFEGDPAYDLYVSLACGGKDPQQDEERLERMKRLIRGTDETSITYL
jgi:hypothetical protein